MEHVPPVMRARGFSLLELLLVMALVAGASLLAVSAFGGGMRGPQLRDAAREVASQLRFARAVAISSGEPQDVAIDPAARRWQGARGRSGRLPAAATVEFIGASPRQLPGAQARDGIGVVRFFPDGAATGGRVRLLYQGAGWDVDVGWLTGEVRVRRTPEAG